MIPQQVPVSPQPIEVDDCCWDLCPSDAVEAGEGVGDGDAQVDVREDDDDDEHPAEGEVQRPIIDPGTPTTAQRAEHELTHWPYRSWCKACVAGMATGRQHRSMVGEAAECDHTRVIMDFAYLKENIHAKDELSSEETADASMTMVVLSETRFGSVWAYAT